MESKDKPIMQLPWPAYMGPEMAAMYLGNTVTPKTLQNWSYKGKLTRYKVGDSGKTVAYSRAELDRLITPAGVSEGVSG